MIFLLFLLTVLPSPPTIPDLRQIDKCDISIVAATQNNVEALTKDDVLDFLLAFGKECQNNAEFGEFSNEVLFLILDKQTELTIRTITTEEKKLEIDVILDDIRSPINDLIDVKKLLTKVEQVKIDGHIKKKVIESLKVAIANNN